MDTISGCSHSLRNVRNKNINALYDTWCFVVIGIHLVVLCRRVSLTRELRPFVLFCFIFPMKPQEWLKILFNYMYNTITDKHCCAAVKINFVRTIHKVVKTFVSP